jgi:hypothetical protein
MIIRKRAAVIVVALCGAIAALEVGSALSVPGFDHVVGEAEARFGRPLTPVSVAGVGRRTVRRCAVGVYHC